MTSMREKEIQKWVELGIESSLMNFTTEYPFLGDGRFMYYAVPSNFPPCPTNKPWILDRETLRRTLIHAGSKRLLDESDAERILGLPAGELMSFLHENPHMDEPFKDPLSKEERAEVDRRLGAWWKEHRSKSKAA